MALAVWANAAVWEKIETGSLSWLHAIKFVDEKRGFIGGSNGTLLVTNDGGGTWQPVKLPMKDTIREIVFDDDLRGWLLCERDKFQRKATQAPSYLLQTSDGGLRWGTVELENVDERLLTVLLNKAELVLAGEGGNVFRWHRSNETARRIKLPQRYLVTDISVSERGAVVVGGGGSIFLSDDLDLNWRSGQIVGGEVVEKLNAICFANRRTGWIAGSGGRILFTSDGGSVWRRQSSGTGDTLLDIGCVDDHRVVAIGDGGTILLTSDTGRKWTREKTPTEHRLEKVTVVGGKVFVVGFGGVLLRAKPFSEL